MPKPLNLLLALVLGLFFLVFSLMTVDAEAKIFSRTQLLMGNVPVTLSVDTSREKKAFTVMESSFALMSHLEKTLSEWQPASDLSRVNDAPTGEWVPIGRPLYELLLKANHMSRITNGYFDITFDSPNKKTSYRDIELHPEFLLVRKNKSGMLLKVSGIAKGFMVDAVAEHIRQQGIRRFLIDAGDLYASGKWKIGIKNPLPPHKPWLLKEVRDKAISTSGAYERGDHLIDPKKRVSAKTMLSVTVISQESWYSDTLAKAFFIKGFEGVKQFHPPQMYEAWLWGKDGRKWHLHP